MKTLPKAMLYAKRLSGRDAPLAVLLLDREVRVLRALVTWYNAPMCCTFVAVPTLAFEASMSVRTCQRALLSLEVRGIIRRLHADTVRDDSQTSNEIEFPELGRVDMNDPVQLAERKRVFTLPRKRKVAQQMELVPKQVPVSDDSAGVGKDVSMTVYPVEALASEDSARMQEQTLSEDSACVLKSCCKVTGAVSPRHRGGDTTSPHEHYEELHDDKYEPPYPLADAHEVQKLPENRSAKATANATANAKTEASEAARVQTERGRGRRNPGRRGRGYLDEREGLDGVDAVVWDVVSDVLKDAGIAPERCTPRLRLAIDAALRLYVENWGGSFEEIGILALERLREFRNLGHRLEVRWSLAVFFEDGHWLWENTWK